MGGCGNMPREGAESRGLAVVAEGAANLLKTAEEKGEKEDAESIASTVHGSTVTVLAFGQCEPDCFHGAKYDVKCADCGVCLDTVYKEALGHARDEGVVTCLPDCTGGGSIKYTCTRCGSEWSETYGRLQPHTWVEGIKQEFDWTEGEMKEVPYLYCSVCGRRKD